MQSIRRQLQELKSEVNRMHLREGLLRMGVERAKQDHYKEAKERRKDHDYRRKKNHSLRITGRNSRMGP